jgi:hypothetical protein
MDQCFGQYAGGRIPDLQEEQGVFKNFFVLIIFKQSFTNNPFPAGFAWCRQGVKPTIMKAIIYAGIGLFAAASVYGVADYYSTQKKGTLEKLYKEEEVKETPVNTIAAPVIAEPLNKVTSVPLNTTNNKAVKIVRKKTNTSKRIRLEDFSRGRIMEPLPVEEIKEEPVKKEEPGLRPAVSITSKPEEISKKEPERKLSLEMFSRAPLKRTIKPVKKSD